MTAGAHPPPMNLSILGWNVALVLGLMTLLWLISVYLRDVSIVDPWWSMSFLLVQAHTVARTGLTPAKTLLLCLVAVWALRLWLHLLWRDRGKPEDPRYASFRQRYGPDRYWWVSFFQVFVLQGVLVVFISSPLQLAAVAGAPDPVTATDLAGLLIFAFGFLFEAVADWQLQSFRRDPGNRGKVLDSGLWRWSRHPNYFGEAVLWWGFWLFAADQPLGWATVLAPTLMTFLLLRVSGVTMLDTHLTRSKPGYREYLRRTSAFVPRRPRD
ncbi:MAG: DUF1295 domain-containing protein [Myxococcales bacterium]|nr:MAG: DUF1295 domain-containing protein [Myxococcales bacterium]